MDQAVAAFAAMGAAKLPALPGATLDIVRLPGRTPVIVIDIPGEGGETVLLYRHLDKQPEMTGWPEGYGPWIPRPRGTSSMVAAGPMTDTQCSAHSARCRRCVSSLPHARCVVLIEACGVIRSSYDLPYYVDHLGGGSVTRLW